MLNNPVVQEENFQLLGEYAKFQGTMYDVADKLSTFDCNQIEFSEWKIDKLTLDYVHVEPT